MLSQKKSDHINLHFVLPGSCDTEDDVIDEMKMAFQECIEADLTPKWISEEHCLSISFTKLDVFVLQEFTGKVFNKLRTTKSVVCGPICLRTCLTEGLTIPENNSPVYTTAMRDLSITASNTTPQKKTKIKEKVGFMGGIYTSNLVEATTHLVSNAVRSAKYEKATEKGITVMTEEWIDAVWKASSERNVKATDDEFQKYKCKIFQGLQLTCSNLDKAEKDKINKLVSENGGLVTPQLHQNQTALLVVSGPHGEKYKHAKKWKLPCVYPSWITESVERGYAVPTTKHLINGEMRCSTPTSTESANFTLGASDQFSLISHDTDSSHVNETALSNASMFSGKPVQSQLQQPGMRVVEYKQFLEKINVSTAKRAGLFVDGCKVYLSGFTPQEVERLRRLLSLGGASIFNELSETVSYVIVGDHVANDVNAISNMSRRPYVVSLEWLVASIKQRGPAKGDLYSCLEQMNIPVEPPSPLSQKGVQLLQPVELNQPSTSDGRLLQTSDPVSRKLFKDFAKPEDVPSQSNNVPTDSQTSSTQEESQSQLNEFFTGLTFKIELDEKDPNLKEAEQIISMCGGLLVGSGFKGVPDYSIVPLSGGVRNVTASEIVTFFWLFECYEKNGLVEIEYYHQPITINSAKKPLEGYCLGSTLYTGKEKQFLILLGEALGAKHQDVFARKPNEENGIMVSTHLLSPNPWGSKYLAAKKWNIPAVTKDWLLACAKNGIKMPEEPFLTSKRNNQKPSTTISAESPMGPPLQTPSLTRKTVTPAPSVGLDGGVGLTSEPLRTAQPSVVSPNFRTPNQQTPTLRKKAVTPAPSVRLDGSVGRSSEPPTTAQPSVVSPNTRTPNQQTPTLRIKTVTPAPSFGLVGGVGISPEPPSIAQPSVASPNVGTCTPSYRGLPNTITPGKRKSCSNDCDSDNSPFHQNTPDTPYGQGFGITPTNSSKKRWKKYIDNFGLLGTKESPPARPRRESTPISELRAQMWEKFFDLNPQANHADSSSSKNMEKLSKSRKDNKENYELRANTPQLLNSCKSSASSSAQSPTTNIEAVPSSSSNGSPGDRVAQHLERLGEQLANHTPTEPLIKRRQDSNTLQPPINSPLDPSTKQIPKLGVIDSQPITIDWEDPVEAAERSKLSKMTIATKVPPKPRRFIIGSNLKNQSQFVQIVTDLGGEVVTSASFEHSTTHIVIDNPVRSEKLLCCLAAGKWILHFNYLLECQRQQKWLPEEDYECGNPRSVDNIPKFSSSVVELAKAAFKWRSKLKDGEGAYSGMKVVLTNIPDTKKVSFQKLVTAGYGEVVDETCFLNATHCCMEPWKGEEVPEFVLELVIHKIPCLKPVFLGEYLYKDPTPSIQDHILPKALNLYRQKNLFD